MRTRYQAGKRLATGLHTYSKGAKNIQCLCTQWLINGAQNLKGNDAKRLEVANHVQALSQIVADIQDDVSKNKNMSSRALEDRVM